MWESGRKRERRGERGRGREKEGGREREVGKDTDGGHRRAVGALEGWRGPSEGH